MFFNVPHDLWMERWVEKSASALCSDKVETPKSVSMWALPSHGQAALGESSDEILLHCTCRTYFCPRGIAIVVCLAGVIQFTPAEQDETMNKRKLNNNINKLAHQWDIKNLRSKWLYPVHLWGHFIAISWVYHTVKITTYWSTCV